MVGRTVVLGYLLGVFSASAAGGTVFLEAEGFGEAGGWVVDQQFIDQMGSSMLLAHGMGRPVGDAATRAEFSEAGEYGVWVRTRDWAATWGAPGWPGRFEVLVDGRGVGAVFGTEGAKWHWQYGGKVKVGAGKVRVSLRDLTGFEGRCDAIVFSNEEGFTPPEEAGELAEFRRKMLGQGGEVETSGGYDLVVVGGGMAGTCSAISAARLGLRVALIENRPVLGGNNSSDVRVHLSGLTNYGPYPALGDVVNELDSGYRGNGREAQYYCDERKLEAVRAEKNISLFLNTHVFKAEVKDGRITAVRGRDIRCGSERRFEGATFADCTGDGNLGFLAGADYRYGRESREETGESMAQEKGDRMVMGTSCLWYAEESEAEEPFPECPWALQFTEETCQHVTRSDWTWETGMNLDQIGQFEQVRDRAFRAIYGNWDFQKNRSESREKYAKMRMAWVAYVGGKRESRRLMGDIVLREQDIRGQKAYPDAAATATWSIDLHFPQPENSRFFPGEEFRSDFLHPAITPYAIPYRCLYSRNIENLFMAGRCISVTHVALGAVRVMRTGGMMGEAVGMAASLCKKYGGTCRQVYAEHLDELKGLMTKGVGVVKSRDEATIDAHFPGGNIIVDRIDGNDVYVRQDMRDTEGWWFWWNFRVRGAGGKRLAFHFAEPSPIGVRGPAVSTDGGANWSWLGAKAVEGAGFAYKFGAEEEDVGFCFAMPYQHKDLQEFLESVRGCGGLVVEEHGETKGDRTVQRLRLGKVDGQPKYRALITCRHHACESMASYVLEGMVQHILTDAEDSGWYRDKVEVMAIPFIDMDGVEAGDQGKNRKPRDHNRDYGGRSIYPEVQQLRNLAGQWSRGKLRAAVDLHCPAIGGGRNERVYLVGSSEAEMWGEQNKFSGFLESVRRGPLEYRASDNIAYGQEWNTAENYIGGKSFTQWAGGLQGVRLSTAVEIPYATVRGEAVTAESARALGRDMARALRKYLEQLE